MDRLAAISKEVDAVNLKFEVADCRLSKLEKLLPAHSCKEDQVSRTGIFISGSPLSRK